YLVTRPEVDDPAGLTSTRAWISRLHATFFDDPTALAPLLVDIVYIPEGDSVHLPAGNLHAYLGGAGIEIMAASDNVLRGGLTPKHIDVAELLEIARFEPGHPDPPEERDIPGGVHFDCHEDAFSLMLLDPTVEPTIRSTRPGVLLATGGAVTLTQGDTKLELIGGRAAFIEPDEPLITASGTGQLW